MFAKIHSGDELIAIIIYGEFRKDGIEFFTPDTFSQQLAYMHRQAGYRIQPHIHNSINRQVMNTQEVLLVRRGRVRVDLYDNQRKYIESRILKSGDVILLATGGHGFEMLEDTEIIEVKQGPYAGENDKTRFDGIPDVAIKVVKSSNHE